MFEQKIEDGWQVECPDFWLSFGNPWEIERADVRYVIYYGGRCVESKEKKKKVMLENFESFVVFSMRWREYYGCSV